MSRKTRAKRRSCTLGCLTGVVLLFFALGGITWILANKERAAQGADVLRAILGDQAVAALEMALFRAEDAVQKVEYILALATPAPPWQAARDLIPTLTLVPTIAIPSSTPSVTTIAAATITRPAVEQPGLSPTVTPFPTLAPTPTQTIWQPAALPPLGTLDGEGIWSPYMQSGGQMVAYRTYLQPDPTRPYSIVAVIAFDLRHTRLHFILGFEEPYSPGGPIRTGAMPKEDRAPGTLLAMFNGGFKATHGKFGAMADGVTALPPRSGLGTLAIYQDDRVRMGVWDQDIQSSPDMECWRQNGPLVIDDGQINPRIYNNSPKDWGYTVTDVSPTWRSAIGLSADEKTLYYLAGNSLSMEALAKSMVSARVDHGMQLDINTYWVHFVAVRERDGERTLEPLFPKMMKENIDRYLYQYSRDYFYVTTAP